MSVSVGGNGYRKTLNTKGQVTTSMGIPGTGIYYTDTKKIGENKQSGFHRNTSISNYGQSDFIESQEEYAINSTVEEYFNPTEQATQIEEEPSEVSYFYEETAGNIDAYLETIEKMRPVDDLMDYGSDFEFGTDNPNSMEVEFRINAYNMLPDANVVGVETYEQIFKEYVCASSIRVARNLFALLPVKYVIVYAKKEDEVVLQARFDKNEVQKINFKEESGVKIIERFILND